MLVRHKRPPDRALGGLRFEPRVVIVENFRVLNVPYTRKVGELNSFGTLRHRGDSLFSSPANAERE